MKAKFGVFIVHTPEDKFPEAEEVLKSIATKINSIGEMRNPYVGENEHLINEIQEMCDAERWLEEEKEKKRKF